MPAFPKLQTGAVAQYPSWKSVQAPVKVLRYVDGSEQRFRSTRRPVRRWVIRLSEVSDSELAAVQQFFANQQGRTGSFEFTDPWDGTVYADCSFDADELTATLTGEDRASATIKIRNNQL